MRILNPRIHGYLDYLVVLLFLVAPSLFGFSLTAARLSYAVAGIQLVISLMTAYPLGAIKLIPFTIHGAYEFIAAILLIAAPWIFGFSIDLSARYFYIASGVVLFAVWATTNYRAADREIHRPNRPATV